jgi:hypothetical protein
MLFAAEFTSHRTRILVNGVDIVGVAFPAGGFAGRPVAGFTPSWLLGPQGLAVSPEEAREVGLGGSDYENRLAARIHRVGSEVIWDCWRVTDMERVVKEGTEVGLEIFRFDAQAYGTELARATVEASRMWPGRAVVEALQAVLRPAGHGLDRGAWIREYGSIYAPEERPDTVEIGYSARDLTGQRYAMPGTYVVTFPVDDTDPDAQARAIAYRLGHEDLKPLSVHRPRRRPSWYNAAVTSTKASGPR